MNIIYFHGFGSAGSTTTAKKLKRLFPEDNVISPDIPLFPTEAEPFLKELVMRHSPDDTIIVGTSMGGFFAQMMRGYRRILVNPAFHVSEIIKPDLGKTLKFFSKRADKIKEYTITQELIDSFIEVENRQFDESISEDCVTGLFGDNDELVDCRDEFSRFYDDIRIFSGGHRLTQDVVDEVILPLIIEFKKREAKP